MSVFADLARWLETQSWPWYLFGGQAALVHGGTRVTADVDVTVVLDPSEFDRLEATIPAAFARRADRAFTEQTLVVPLMHLPSAVPVDLVLGATAFEAEIASRARRARVGGSWTPLIAAEDLLVLKLLAGRPHDLFDAAEVRAANPNLDEGAVRARVAAFAAALDDPDLERRAAELFGHTNGRAARREGRGSTRTPQPTSTTKSTPAGVRPKAAAKPKPKPGAKPRPLAKPKPGD